MRLRAGPPAAALVAAACAFGGGCSSDRAGLNGAFPIGLYGVRAAEMEAVSRAGFDAAYPLVRDGAEAEAAAGAARRAGIRLLPDYRLLSPAGPSVKRWPVLAWYLQDEPDVNHVPAAELERRSREVRGLDGRPQTFVVGSGAAASVYGPVGDALMLDWYPVPHLPLEGVAEQADAALLRLPPGKPLWMVIQAFDWRDDAQRDPSKPRVGRFPTYGEIRFMSYAAVLHGAKGLFYYRFNQVGAEQGKSLLDFPERWQALSRVASELRTLKPILREGRPAPIPFPPNPDGLDARMLRHGGRDFLILLNPKKGFYRRVPEAALGAAWRPLFEDRRDVRDLLKKIGDHWFLPPHRVLVLESASRRWGAPGTKLW